MFNLNAFNGQWISCSEYYFGNTTMEKGIVSVNKNTLDTKAEDISFWSPA
jgi:uncharacterized protein YegP (UPF0339 family)